MPPSARVRICDTVDEKRMVGVILMLMTTLKLLYLKLVWLLFRVPFLRRWLMRG
jgi:hypothetical protein